MKTAVFQLGGHPCVSADRLSSGHEERLFARRRAFVTSTGSGRCVVELWLELVHGASTVGVY